MSVNKKILEIQQTLDVKKTGYDERNEYFYFKADDVANAVRDKMNEVGLIHRTEIAELHEDNFYDTNGRNRPRITVKGRVIFIDPDDDSEFVVEAVGTGSDTGGDKAARKAAVQLFKIVAIDTFLISEDMGKFDSDGDKEAEPVNMTPPTEAPATVAELTAEVGRLIKEVEGIDAAAVNAVGTRLAKEILGDKFDAKVGFRKDARVLEALVTALKAGEVE